MWVSAFPSVPFIELQNIAFGSGGQVNLPFSTLNIRPAGQVGSYENKFQQSAITGRPVRSDH
jgi:hypothetical protein